MARFRNTFPSECLHNTLNQRTINFRRRRPCPALFGFNEINSSAKNTVDVTDNSAVVVDKQFAGVLRRKSLKYVACLLDGRADCARDRRGGNRDAGQHAGFYISLSESARRSNLFKQRQWRPGLVLSGRRPANMS